MRCGEQWGTPWQFVHNMLLGMPYLCTNCTLRHGRNRRFVPRFSGEASHGRRHCRFPAVFGPAMRNFGDERCARPACNGVESGLTAALSQPLCPADDGASIVKVTKERPLIMLRCTVTAQPLLAIPVPGHVSHSVLAVDYRGH